MKKSLYSSILLLSFFLAGVSYAQIQPPVLQSPPNGDTTQGLTITFNWSDVAGATGYEMQIYQDVDLILDTTVTLSQSTVSGIFAVNTWYTWRVRTWVGSQSSNWTAYWSFRTAATAPPGPPILSLPANGAQNQPLNLRFAWYRVLGANYYRLQVCTSNTFTGTFAIDQNGLTDTQFVATNQLGNNTIYYWRVNATNQAGTSQWSSVWSFTTIVAPPGPPSLLSPPNGAQNQTITPLLKWNPAPGAVYYHLKISSDPNFVTTVFEANNISGVQISVPSGYLWGDQWFYWKVASGNAAGEGQYSAAWSFKTLPGPPPPPQLVYPVNNSTCVSRFPQLSWNPVTGTNPTYTIWVSWDPNFAYGNLQVNVGGWSQTQYTITNNVLQNGTKYYWKVQATTLGGTGPWSQVWNFTVIPLPPTAPALTYPPNNVLGVPLDPLFNWLAGANAEKYQIQVATNPGFGTTILDYTTPDTVTQYQMQPGILQGGTLYYWRVRSINCTTQMSAWSSIWSFTTQVTLTANLKVYLEGFYNGSTQVRDTINVYLANPTIPYAFRDSTQVYLGSNGTGALSFQNAPNGSYYIIVMHRNHLETWSAAPQQFTFGTPVNYDFTTASNKAYGNNMKQVGSVWVLYGGDANQDGNVDPADYTLFYTSQFGRDGYISCDFNGDNFVDGYDLPILYSNQFKSKSRP